MLQVGAPHKPFSAATTPSNSLTFSGISASESMKPTPLRNGLAPDSAALIGRQSVLCYPPELARHLQLRNLLLQGDGDIVAGLQVYEPNERALEVARICAPVEIGLRFD